MKLSRNFVNDYIDLDKKLTITEIAEAMTNVGNEYDSADALIPCTNLVIGQITECENHPDSDHLHICKVDIKSNVLDIVCGAPNVRVGLKVIVALVGAKLPGGVIKAGLIRGQESNGMMCSKSELGLDSKFLDENDKDGIHEVAEDIEIGLDAVKALNLDDEVIDFDLTANRGDLLSILGMAYELGAIYRLPVKDIDLNFKETNTNINDFFELEVLTDDCPLFLVKKVENVVIKESPEFIKTRLIASGIRPINNVVDISNYVMLETGQPLHYYDADNLGNKIVVRNAKNNETLTTLDGNKRLLAEEDIVIATDDEAIGLAGVMGGLSTEVESNTKNIIIEAAIFNNVKIRKTAKKILRSEASNRFEKGIDPNRTYMAILRSCTLLEKYAEATIVGDMVIYDKTKTEEKIISITVDKINKVLGTSIKLEEVTEIFTALDFKYQVKEENILVEVPTRRLDISIQEDLIEEVGRIYGMDNIIGKLPALDVITGKYNKTNRSVKNKLIDLGLNEVVSYSLIPKKEVFKYTLNNFIPVEIADPMSEDRNTLRNSLIYSLKDFYDYNKSRNNTNVSIFEMGKGFYKEENTYKENLKLACLMSGNYYLSIKKEKVDFYIIKGLVEELLDFLGYQGRYSFIQDNTIPKELHPGVSASIVLQGKSVGIIGKLHPSVTRDDIYVFELNLDKILENRTGKMQYKEIPKYPSSIKDVAFIVSENIQVSMILETIKKAGGKLLTNIELFDLYKGGNIGNGKKSLAFNLTFMDSSKTLTEEEIMTLFDEIIKTVIEKHQAILRDK